MFTNKIESAVSAAKSLNQIQAVSIILWKAHAEKLINDDQAQKWAETLDERKKAIKARLAPSNHLASPGANFGSSRRVSNPERMSRRRSWAFSGSIPQKLALHFSPAELAVVSTVLCLLKKNPSLIKTAKEIADISGTSIRTVRYALKVASDLQIFSIERRRISAFRNAANKITIGTNPLIRSWVSKDGLMVQNAAPLNSTILNQSFRRLDPAPSHRKDSHKLPSWRRTQNGQENFKKSQKK